MNYSIVRYVCLALSIFCLQTTIAQEGFYGGYGPAITAAPTAAKAAKASGSSVDLSTGAIQHALPIYTIKQNGVSWPVGLQYRYTGLQVMEAPSPIGLGWSLVATGMISREVRGLPDDHPKGYHGLEHIRQTILDPYYHFDPNNSPGTGGKQVLKEHHAYLLANGLIDGEPDLFTVNAGALNFSFKIGINGQPVLLSHHNVEVNFGWDQIEVIDAEGVKYIFAAKEIFDPYEPDLGVIPITEGDYYTYPRSWYLSSIQPPNTTQQITFEYQNQTDRRKAFVPKVYSLKSLSSEFLFDQNFEGDDPKTDPYVYPHVRMDVDITTPILTKINFAEGSLDFTIKPGTSGIYHQYNRITLNDYNHTVINSYDLYTQRSRRLLTEIKKNDQLEVRFDYYDQDNSYALPDYDFDKEEITSGMDKWGYYAGRQVSSSDTDAVIRDYPYFKGTVQGALQTMTSKSGGQITIVYELNSYAQGYGGIRVQSIESCGGTTSACTKKEYDYSTEELGSSAQINSVVRNTNNADYVGPAKPIYYAQVSERVVSSDPNEEIHNGRTVYTFEDPKVFENAENSGNDVLHNLAPRGEVEGGIRIKSVRTYKDIDGTPQPTEQLLTEQRYEYVPVQMDRDTFGNSLDPNYPYAVKVRSIKGVKRELNLREFIRRELERNGSELLPYLHQLIPGFREVYEEGTQVAYEEWAREAMNKVGLVQGFSFDKYILAVGDQDADAWMKQYEIETYKETNTQPLQKRVISRTYSDIDPTQYSENTTAYVYDQYHQMTGQTQTNSKGEVQQSSYYYPYHPDINNTHLMSAHRMASPVKTETFIGPKKQATAVVNFNTTTSGYYLPSIIQGAKEGAPLKDQTIYHKYDAKGNALEISQGKGPHTVYIWGYNDLYPIAKVGNATYDQVAAYVADLKAKSNADTDRTLGYTGAEGALRQALDALRDALPNAIVTTYTYDPLIGLTSTTDPRGYTTYTEYDGLYRLLHTRDEEHNIIGKYYYNDSGIQYDPIVASIISDKNWMYTSTTLQITSEASGGSSRFAYSWKLTKPGMAPEYFTGTNLTLHAGTTEGMATIELTITDTITSKTKVVNKSISIYPPLSGSAGQISRPANLTVNNTASFNITPSGGSGSYTYSWTISGRAGTYTSSQKSFGLYMNYTYYGNVNIQCVVRDTKTGDTETLTTTMNVYDGFWTASINTRRHSSPTGTKKLELLAKAGSGSGNYSYKWYVNGNYKGSSSSLFITLRCSGPRSESVKCIITDNITGKAPYSTRTFSIGDSECSSSGGGGGGGGIGISQPDNNQ
ncbi:SprB repeat-containing protein [Aquimarina mytili]|uniref:SprB repeat-containing protein n=1 Tax=Aquimarina mytili TaxID=874423 RepID=A0A936ZTQ1_9FLAO|nr:SprB repeat-containing protein [Aquimarina mytili]MBL0684112.1 SprB repeat-containing protein [Aquimarina mytili]